MSPTGSKTTSGYSFAGAGWQLKVTWSATPTGSKTTSGCSSAGAECRIKVSGSASVWTKGHVTSENVSSSHTKNCASSDIVQRHVSQRCDVSIWIFTFSDEPTHALMKSHYEHLPVVTLHINRKPFSLLLFTCTNFLPTKLSEFIHRVLHLHHILFIFFIFFFYISAISFHTFHLKP